MLVGNAIRCGSFLVFIVMGNLAGYRGNRPLEEFAQRYGSEVADLLQIDLDAVPSFSTFRRAHIGLDFCRAQRRLCSMDAPVSHGRRGCICH
ncbi:MAG: hypothetical protein F6K00_29000 [Leptolyngbya sp. SIOISBB]|nr:hypothetical protein [Leptolyngbya sp. SIOISBB]